MSVGPISLAASGQIPDFGKSSRSTSSIHVCAHPSIRQSVPTSYSGATYTQPVWIVHRSPCTYLYGCVRKRELTILSVLPSSTQPALIYTPRPTNPNQVVKPYTYRSLTLELQDHKISSRTQKRTSTRYNPLLSSGRCGIEWAKDGLSLLPCTESRLPFHVRVEGGSVHAVGYATLS